jgi:AraC-like DNA-binding protein
MLTAVAIRSEVLPVSVPDVRAVRWWSDELYGGVKETYSIARIESGRLEWWCRGRVWPCGPGSVLLIQPGDVHRDVSRDGPSTLQVVTLPADAVESATGKLDRLEPRLVAGDHRARPFERLHAAVEQRSGRLEMEVAVADAIMALRGVNQGATARTRPVRRALELLHARLAEPVTLDELANHAVLDKFHLCRAFRAQIGMPPHAYLTRLRIMRAKALLVRGVRPSDVAPQVGFYDQSQLNRHFRRIVGTTPARYARGVH